MTTDYRALCAELADIVTAHASPDDDAVGYVAAVLTRARAALDAEPAPPAGGEVAELVAMLRDHAADAQAAGWLTDAARFHRAADLLERLAPQPVPVVPSDQELADTFAEGCIHASKSGEPPFLGGARAVLARWGRQ